VELNSEVGSRCNDEDPLNENEHYQNGNYRLIPDTEVPPVIADPSTIGSPASMIVQHAFEVDITIGLFPDVGSVPTSVLGFCVPDAS
jgi:hypothetical protein